MPSASVIPIRQERQPKPTGRLLLVVFLVAFALRGGWGVWRMAHAQDPAALEFPDEVDYWSMAQSLARGDGLVGEHGFRALRMPLYPALLCGFASNDGGVVYAKVAQWLLGALAAVLIVVLGARIAGPRAGMMAGLLVAFDPFLIFFSSLLLTETVFITAQSALWLVGWSLLQDRSRAELRDWLLVGLCSALCIYIREASILVCLLWMGLLFIRQRARRTALVGAAMAVLVVFASLLPWALRNERVTGQWCWFTHRAGISLYDGVGPQATGAGDLADIKQSEPVQGLSEVAWNRYFIDQSIKSVKADPMRILRLAAVKVARTWNPLPNVETYRSWFIRMISAAWTIPVYVLAVVGAAMLFRRDRPVLVALLLPAFCVLVLHSVFVGSVRYRLVAMPTLELLAAVTVAAMVTARRASPARASASP